MCAIQKEIRKAKSIYWRNLARIERQKLFDRMVSGVKAYREILIENNLRIDSCLKQMNFDSLPVLSKNNYITRHELPELMHPNALYDQITYTSTSGTTGLSSYFVRNSMTEQNCSVYMEWFLRQSGYRSRPTLVIVCFGMGIWIGGSITYRAFEHVASRNEWPISIITPGVNKKEIISSLKKLVPYYDAIVFAGYPPFIKDVIDEALEVGINFSGKEMRVKLAAESFSEEFRDYITKAVGVFSPVSDIVNVYGSAELGAMGMEATTGVLIKKLIKSNPKVRESLFGRSDILPTLAQYIPLYTNFDSHDGELYVSGDGPLPLLKYTLGDQGGVYDYDDLNGRLLDFNIDIKKEAEFMGISDKLSELPFVYVFDRMGSTVSFYGLRIYPEWIKYGLLNKEAKRYFTGKFAMSIGYDQSLNQQIHIAVELRKDLLSNKDLASFCERSITEGLCHSSSEFITIFTELKNRAKPRITLHSYEDPAYFNVGSKQKWTI